MTSKNRDWVDDLYQPKYGLEHFLKHALGPDDSRRAEKETQANLQISPDKLIDRASQTNPQLWEGQDVALLRRAYATQLENLKAKYSTSEQVQDLQTELQEVRENFRSTQQDLETCRIELAEERAESQRLRIAMAGLKRFSSAQLAEADDARWVAQFERTSSMNAFKQRMADLQRQRVEMAADRARQLAEQERLRKSVPSILDVTTVYRLSEEAKAENRRLQSELDEAISALSEYDRAYNMLLKHLNSLQK